MVEENNMINYYKNNMDSSYKQWQTALKANKPIATKLHREDYINYKEMYESRMKACGKEV